MTESVSSLAFLLCLLRKKPRPQEESRLCVRSSGTGDTSPGQSVQMSSPPFLAAETQSKLSKKREGRAGKGTGDQEGTGPAELSSFLGPATKSRTRESVRTAPTHRALQTHIGAKAGPPCPEGSLTPQLCPRSAEEGVEGVQTQQRGKSPAIPKP